MNLDYFGSWVKSFSPRLKPWIPVGTITLWSHGEVLIDSDTGPSPFPFKWKHDRVCLANVPLNLVCYLSKDTFQTKILFIWFTLELLIDLGVLRPFCKISMSFIHCFLLVEGDGVEERSLFYVDDLYGPHGSCPCVGGSQWPTYKRRLMNQF